MVLHAGDMAGRLADRATRSGMLSLIGNPIIAALVLTVIALVVFFTLLGEEECLSELGWNTRFRVAIYFCTGAFFILGLHYYALDRSFRNQYSNEATETLVANLGNSQKMASMGAYDSSRVPVVPGTRSGQPGDGSSSTTGAYERPDEPSSTSGVLRRSASSTTNLDIVPAEVNLMPQGVIPG